MPQPRPASAFSPPSSPSEFCPPAKATSLGGYTYTQRVCQEYGQQPRYYNVRDGQAAYNGGNSDSGWLIVLEHSSHVAAVAGTPDRYVRNDASGDYILYQSRYIQLTGNRWTRHGPGDYRLNPAGNRVRVATTPWRPGDPTPNADFVAFLYRYDRIPGTPDIPARGGQYVRWANMAWCR